MQRGGIAENEDTDEGKAAIANIWTATRRIKVICPMVNEFEMTIVVRD
jgi:hypothetical protein